MGTTDHEQERSLVDRLEHHVEHEANRAARFDKRDPAFIESIMPAVRFALKWFDAEVEGIDNVPAEGPSLVVANHSGGFLMPDYWSFLSEWVHQRGASAPLYSLGFDLLFSIPGTSGFALKAGTVPANHSTADELLRRGATVLVYPGGDEDDYRPWTERHRVDLQGRMGFVRLALRHQVPVVPMVSHGSHDAIVVVARGDEIARALGLRRFRINVFPIMLGPTGPTLQLAVPPMPAKVTSRVCEPFDWSGFGPEAADDADIVRHCYEEILGRMQANLDELVAQVPHPVRARIGSALGLDRLTRFGSNAP